jgi:hypothetical protein
VDAASKFDAATVRELLRTHSLPDQPLSQSYDRQRNVLEFTTSTYSRNMERCDHLADALKSNSAVLGFSMLLVDDAGARDTVG